MPVTVGERLGQVFVELADTLVAGYDLMEFLRVLAERCVELLEVDAAGLLLADAGGVLRLVAASTEQARVLELFQVQDDVGPCVATIGILQERAVREREVVAGQLQVALNSRVVIEQAKGILAERLGVSPDAAFMLLRRFARDHNHRLTELAGDVIRGTAPMVGGAAPPPAPPRGPRQPPRRPPR